MLLGHRGHRSAAGKAEVRVGVQGQAAVRTQAGVLAGDDAGQDAGAVPGDG